MVQEDYEVTPDEKRKSRGDKIIKTFLSKQVSFVICKLLFTYKAFLSFRTVIDLNESLHNSHKHT